jgi:hypothetical protein
MRRSTGPLVRGRWRPWPVEHRGIPGNHPRRHPELDSGSSQTNRPAKTGHNPWIPIGPEMT